MTYIKPELVEISLVHIGDDAAKKLGPQYGADKAGTFQTFRAVAAGTSVQVLGPVLGHIPRRCKGIITVIGAITDVAYLCASQSDANNLAGAVICGTQVIPLENTDAVYIAVPAANPNAMAFGVASTIE